MRNVIVFDINMEYIKVGFAGEEKPKLIIPNIVGLPSKSPLDEKLKGVYFKDVKLDKDIYFGEDAINNRFNLKMFKPIDVNFKIERDLLSKILENIIFSLLNIKGRQYYIITYPLLVPNQFIEDLAKLFFEKFNPLGLSMLTEPYATLLATNKNTGLIVYIDSSTQILPIWEGTSFDQFANLYPISMLDLKEHLQRLISSKSNFMLSDDALEEISRYCIIAVSHEYYEKLANGNKKSIPNLKKEFKFDGKKIFFDLERYYAAEIFFNPILMGKDCVSLPDFLINMTNNFERNMRKDLYQSIILGGRGCFQGFAERLENELKKINNVEINIENFALDYANIIAWIGASKLSSHPDFMHFMVSPSEYFEEGSQVINKIKFEKYNTFLNLKEIKLSSISDNIKLVESPEFIDKLTQILKQNTIIELKKLANIFELYQEELKEIINSLLKKGQLKGEFIEKTDEFKFWVTDNPQEIERIKKSLKMTIQQSSEILFREYIQRLENLQEIKDLKTLKARSDEFFDDLSLSDEKMNLLLKIPIPISNDEIMMMLKYWNFVYLSIKEKFRKAIPSLYKYIE